jgi:hypothetical protein
MIVVCVLLGGGTLLFLKFSEKRKKAKGRDKEELAQMTANEFVNVKDIRGSFLYTRDGMALAYLKIFPISTELFSKNEKRLISKLNTGVRFPSPAPKQKAPKALILKGFRSFLCF